jgi:hypothetical protein
MALVIPPHDNAARLRSIVERGVGGRGGGVFMYELPTASQSQDFQWCYVLFKQRQGLFWDKDAGLRVWLRGF